jgi:hypothetical protein
VSGPIVYIDSSEILEGKLDEVKSAIDELVDFVDANEPQLISYDFFLNQDGTLATVVAIHPDSASMELHMVVGGPRFRKFTGLIRLLTIDVFGEISQSALERLHQKARMLGSGTVTVHKLYAGFTRSDVD